MTTTGTVMVRRPKLLCASIVAVTCIFTAALLFVVIPVFSSRLHQFYNQNEYADEYDQLARNLAEGHGYRMYPDTAATMVREPGYPVLLAGIFLLFGNKFSVVKLAHMLLAFATAWLIMQIVRKLSTSKVVMLLSPLLFLLHPGTVIAESRGGVEVLFTFLLTLFVLTLYIALESDRWLDYVVSGAVLGLTVLVRSTLLLFPVILLAYHFAFERRRATVVICRNILSMFITMVLVLSPWVIRNYLLTREFIPTATVVGISAHAGQYVNTHLGADNSWGPVDREGARLRAKIADQLGYRVKHVEGAYYQYFYFSNDEVKFSNYLVTQVVAGYERSPVMFMRCVRSNLFNFWFRGKTRSSTTMNVIVQTPYLLLAIIGVVLCVRRKHIKPIAPLVCLLVYMVVVYVPILAQARYSVPLIPFLSILVGIGLSGAQIRTMGSSATGGRHEVF